MKKYELSDEQIKNIKIFLQRTSLSGDEVPAFNQIAAILNQPVKDPSPEQIIKDTPTALLLAELQQRDDWDSDLLISSDNTESEPEEGIDEEELIEEPVKKVYKVKKSSLIKNKG